jgi:hypothetical protein
MTTQAEILRVGGMYYNPNRIELWVWRVYYDPSKMYLRVWRGVLQPEQGLIEGLE